MKLIPSIFLLALALVACGSGGTEKSATSGASADSLTHQPVAELPMPEIPDSLQSPDSRVDYALTHFWDAMDFADPAMAADSALVEQTFSNFISILPYVSDDSRRKAVTMLLDRAARGSDEAYSFIISTAEHYLWEADSPFFSEELYLPFVDYIIACGGDDAAVAEYRREVIMKNRPGSQAPDFKAVSRDSRPVRLSDNGSRPTLLMFYEPDCERCLAAIDILSSDNSLADAVAAGKLRVLAVYVGDNRDLWQSHAATLPDAWEVAIDRPMTIDDQALYDIRATPSFYLIDDRGTILLKDAPLTQITTLLSRL